MRLKTNIDPEKVYIAGRTGELVDFVNPLTYSLIDRLFGHQGPYRQVMHEFGIGDLNNTEGYFVNIYGRIYSDIALENEIMWLPTGYKLVIENSLPVLHTELSKKYFPANIGQRIKHKLFKLEVAHDSYYRIKQVRQNYQQLAKTLIQVRQRQQIAPPQFIQIMANYFRINHIFEILSHSIPTKSLADYQEQLEAYFKKFDFLNYRDQAVAEHEYTHLGFNLGHHEAITLRNKNLVPDYIPAPPKLPNRLRYYALLRCMKNNSRLKTYPLVYYLNQYLLEKIKPTRLHDFSFLTIDEIESIDQSTLPFYSAIIAERKAYYRLSEKFNLLQIIESGKLSIEKMAGAREVWQGTPCSKGYIEGMISYVEKPTTEVKTKIVILPNASPEFTPVFRRAKGLVFLEGSPLSHGAIAARELGIPAVVVDGDFKGLINSRFALDGTNGILTLLQ